MVHEHGYWLDRAQHCFDAKLCQAMTEMFSGSVVDIGCGNGAYVKEFLDAGFVCTGYDGNPLTFEISGYLCRTLDFSEPQQIGRFDTVISLEVGEHIPQEYEQIFLDNIVRAAKNTVCLSWAIEGQAGNGHVNCRSNAYIISEMNVRGLTFDSEATEKLRKQSHLPWFRDTIMIFNMI